MATEIIRGNLTSTYVADSLDTIILNVGASLVTANHFGLTGRSAAETGISIVINGTLGTTGVYAGTPVTDSAVFLGATATGGLWPVAGHNIRIGASGHVFSTGGVGIFAIGSGSRIRNDGLVEGIGGIESAGQNNLVQNVGTVAFGLSGIGVGAGSDYSIIQNLGTLRFDAGLVAGGNGNLAINVQSDNVSIFNGGQIVADAGIRAFGNGVSIRNSGIIDTQSGAIIGLGDNLVVTNSGTLTSAATGLHAVQMSGQVNVTLNNSGAITSAGDGVNGGLTRMTNSGDITAAGSGIMQSAAADFWLSNSGDIIGGTSGVMVFNDGRFTTILNTGTISGRLDAENQGPAIQAEGGVVRITNAGTLLGDVVAYGNRNQIINSGVIDGDVILFGDASSVTMTGAGTVLGNILGSGGPCRFQGGSNADRMFGGESNDVLGGGGGADLLQGGEGRDTLTGGAGSDVFTFTAASEISGYFGNDRITDFISGLDHIDLSAFMSGGRFIGSASFHGQAGELRYNALTGQLAGDLDGDRATDWNLTLLNKPSLTAVDFIF